jgi:hypothetical protein
VLLHNVQDFGLGAIEPYLQKIFEAVTLFLNEKAPCQRPSDDEEDAVRELAFHLLCLGWICPGQCPLLPRQT